ncbi:MAG TPA: CAAX prenyl protease-related protein [Desulfuromonadaceae bacterium]|nr:CAAX prenyl protease-related protein [Desulfuromonadaceae bacterium]
MRRLDNLFRSPLAARITPFAIFLALTACQGQFGAASAYWFYLAKTIVGAWLIWKTRSTVQEMRWAVSWEAIVGGIAVFAAWVGLDQLYPKFFHGNATGNPAAVFGDGSALAWFFIIVHIAGMTAIVPPIEEVFYRSFLYRYIAKGDFLSVPLNRFLPVPFFATAIVFGFSHNEWLAGILCGMAYQWLVIRKNRLGDAMTAHAITNFLLGLWIVWKHDWHFW